MTCLSPNKIWQFKIPYNICSSSKPPPLFLEDHFVNLRQLYWSHGMIITSNDKIHLSHDGKMQMMWRVCKGLSSLSKCSSYRGLSLMFGTACFFAHFPYILIYNFPTPLPQRKRSTLLLFICTRLGMVAYSIPPSWGSGRSLEVKEGELWLEKYWLVSQERLGRCCG